MASTIGATIARGTDATPAAGNDGTPHPAHIHAGTCENLGDVVFPLNDVIAYVLLDPAQATPVVGMDATPSFNLTSTPVARAGQTTTVDASLDDILAEDHAINVHQSAEAIDVYITCGNITGEPEAGLLDVNLDELNDSGYTGQVTLIDNGDGTTMVTVTIIETVPATPAATPPA